MPWTNMSDVPESLKGIDPPITLEQANSIASVADSIEGESAWPTAIAQFKDGYEIKDGAWAKKIAETAGNKESNIDTNTLISDMTLKEFSQFIEALFASYNLCESAEDNHYQSMVAELRESSKGNQDSTVLEASMSLGDLEQKVRQAYRIYMGYDQMNSPEPDWTTAVFSNDEQFGNAIVVDRKGTCYLLPYEVGVNGDIAFSSWERARPVEKTWIFKNEPNSLGIAPEIPTELPMELPKELPEELPYVEEATKNPFAKTEGGDEPSDDETEGELEPEDEPEEEDEEETEEEKEEVEEAAVTESAIVFLAESSNDPAPIEEPAHLVEVDPLGDPSNRRGPARVLVEFIQPGWGNSRDGNYYSPEMLKENAKVFENAKMFITEHVNDEHNERNRVAVIGRIVRFSPAGAPVAEVIVTQPDFCEHVRNMSDAGVLHTLNTSIYAQGVRRKASVGGREGWVVEKILSSPQPTVDFVSFPGAGGRAVSLMESNSTQEEVLTEDEVTNVLIRSKAPMTMVARLREQSYKSEQEVEDAVAAERRYISEALGSGLPHGVGGSSPSNQTFDRKRLEERYSALDSKWFGNAPAVR